MPPLILPAAILVVGGLALVALREQRRRQGRGRDRWIGSDGASGSADSGGALWSAPDSGADAAGDFSGNGGDFGGGGASGDWDGGSDGGSNGGSD